MATSLVLLPLLLLCAAAVPASSAARVPADTAEAAALPLLGETVHDLLPKYGLPRGLLPANVTSYSMGEDGHFVVKLAAPCYVQFQDLVYYDRTVKGKITYGAISDLSGIQVKKVFVWISVTGMVADAGGKSIDFQAGWFSETLPASMFAEIPSCGKGVSAAPCHDAAAAAIEAA